MSTQGPGGTPWAPSWNDPPIPPEPKRGVGILVVTLLVGAAAAVVAAWLVFDGMILSRGDAATEDLPPSERGLLPATTTLPASTTSAPALADEPNTESSASRSGQRFSELDCEFLGTSTLEPSLDIGLPFGGGRHRMGLEDGARFDCMDGTQRSAGVIDLDATFESLNAFNGVTTGSGTIRWEEVAPDERVPDDPTPTSPTAVEIQLDFPVIVVWTTILDGPYTGFRGRLVLRDWEQLFDEGGAIEGIRFAPTSATFAPT